MTTHAYTEDQLVEQPAIGLFGVLGWQTVSALEETFGSGGGASFGITTADEEARGPSDVSRTSDAHMSRNCYGSCRGHLNHE